MNKSESKASAKRELHMRGIASHWPYSPEIHKKLHLFYRLYLLWQSMISIKIKISDRSYFKKVTKNISFACRKQNFFKSQKEALLSFACGEQEIIEIISFVFSVKNKHITKETHWKYNIILLHSLFVLCLILLQGLHSLLAVPCWSSWYW